MGINFIGGISPPEEEAELDLLDEALRREADKKAKAEAARRAAVRVYLDEVDKRDDENMDNEGGCPNRRE